MSVRVPAGPSSSPVMVAGAVALAVAAIAACMATAAPTVAASGAPAAQAAPAQASPHAPDRPPLATGSGTGASTSEEASESSPSSGGEPLAGNGLSSPLCGDGGEADLPAGAARACRSTGFEAAQAPSGDYAFDVHIDTGVAHAGNYVAAFTQDLLQFGWASLVAVVHALIVLLDWCFTLDLLNSPAMSGVGRTLHAMQATFTQPWLATMLAIAAVGVLYHGLIRRRVAQTLGEALLMVAMMAGGLWVIMNPLGTLGALGAWANEASLGTFGAVLAGTPTDPRRTLAESDAYVFGAAIDGPWCYLEFGDVSWCESSAAADPRLRTAALKIAAVESGGSGEADGVPRKILELELGISGLGGGSRQSAALLRAARTNGELFLALPANGSARNSIDQEWSLYHVLCGGEEPCRGSTAGEADFRTQSGTVARVLGAGFIAVGLLGMILVLGFIALRLLYAAIMSLVCLLLTPAAVLAPALGERGRGAFRAWATRLLGAVVSKLLFAFLLGAVLQSERALEGVRLGWWTQWVLVSAMWWIAFVNRHKVLDFAHGERGGGGGRQSVLRRASSALESRKGIAAARMVRRRLAKPAPSVQRQRKLAQAGRERADQLAGEQVTRSLRSELGQAHATMQAEPAIQQAIAAKRARLTRMRAEHARAHDRAQAAKERLLSAASDPPRFLPLSRRVQDGLGAEERSQRKRAASLQGRMASLQAEIDGEQQALTVARRTVRDAEETRRATGNPHTREQTERHGRLLDEQAALPRGRRDYAALAGLAGHGREEYEALDEPNRRAARAAIDRELQMRRELSGAVAHVAAQAGGAPNRRERRKAGKHLEHRVDERVRGERPRRPADPGGEPPIETWKREGAERAGPGSAGGDHVRRRRRSSVLEDAREVQARRKRQLGKDRP